MGEKMYPFRKATLQDCSGDLKCRWYINFYVWDVQKSDLIRKREYSINEYKTAEERRAFARQRIETINSLLSEGYHIDSKKNDEVIVEINDQTTLEEALKTMLAFKKNNLRKKSYSCFSSTLNNFLTWARKNRLSNVDLNFFDRNHARQYIDNLIINDKLSGRTVNNKVAYLKSLFNGLLERDFVAESPFAKIKKQKEVNTYQNVAFTDAKIAELKPLIQIQAPDLWNFIQFIYFGYLRPGEIRFLKTDYIDLVAGKIFIPAGISKNAKDDYIDIHPLFHPTLKELLTDKKSKEYLFPGNIKGKPVSENYMTKKHKNFLEKLGFDDRHTLYSWKHTGVVKAYLAGVDIKSLQRQCRHHSIEMTDNYLKSLGLYNNEAFLMKMPGL